MTTDVTLKTLLGSGDILVAPGVYDGLSGLMAEQAGAQAVYLSGASIAYTRFGRPDVGLVTLTEVADTLGMLCDRVSVPVIVDGDNGYGNALNVQRTIRLFERAGAAAIQLEDQVLPKRCGHFEGKKLISGAEMCGKIEAACDARRDEETLIVARTDAIAVDGFDAALDRAQSYAEAGADVLFVEAPQSVEQMKAIVERLGHLVPLLANMVEGGKTPPMSAADLDRVGFRLVIFPGGLVRAQASATQAYFESLLAHGSNQPFRDRMVDLSGINDIIGTTELLDLGRKYEEEG